MSLPDAEARRAIQEDLDATLVVEAAAGTGKTTALVGRIVALIKSGRTTLSKIVAVTFTDKAAGEMKLRLRETLESLRGGPDPEIEERLLRALAELETARISTIHSFAHDLLRERPVEAGVDPLFEVLPEPEARALYERVFELWFQRALQDPPPGVERVLRRAGRGGKQSPRAELRSAGWQLCETRDFPGGWSSQAIDRERELDAIIDGLREIGALAELERNPSDWLRRSFDTLRTFVLDLEHREQVRPRDYDALDAELRQLLYERAWNWSGGRRPFGGQDRQPLIERRQELRERIETYLDDSGAELAALLREELRPLVEEYRAQALRTGRLDFLDLLLRVRVLLSDDAALRGELQERISHLLIDEFQDTDPLQAEIVLLLAADDPAVSDPDRVFVSPGKLFIVGDPKQSIYRFRRADVALYERFKERLVRDGARLLQLSASFRSDPRIQAFVNAAFEPVMDGEGQARYVPLEAVREASPERPAVVVLPVPQPYTDGVAFLRKRGVEEGTPDAVAAYVSWLLEESGWTVSEGGGRDAVPLEARHVCLLFKAFRGWSGSGTEAFTRALEQRGLSHVLVGGRSFHDREEVLAVRAALTAIEWPADELAVYAALKGPLFALGDEALLRWKSEVGALHPLLFEEAPEDPVLSAVGEALELLATLHRKRQRRPVADTIEALLDATRAHAGFLLWHGGEQVLGNVLRLQEMARRFERRGAISFRSFLQQLENEAEHGEARGDAAVVEEGTDGVRLMTVHRAKGLEFPVVIICDFTRPARGRRPSRHQDAKTKSWFQSLAGCAPKELNALANEVLERDEEETQRLLYVAATRARDLLVIPSVGDRPPERVDWLSGTWTGLFEPLIRAEEPPTAPPGCPPFGPITVIGRPLEADFQSTMKPGRYQRGDVDFCWWDPGLLREGAKRERGMRRQRVLQDVGGGANARTAAAHDAWASERKERIERASRPSRQVVNPSRVGVAPESDHPLSWEETPAARSERPRGRRFGTLVHAALEVVAFDAEPPAIEAAVAHFARQLGADREEETAASIAVSEALRHPLLQAAAESADCRRECPLLIPGPEEGAMIEGIVDLAYLGDDGTWVVIDFKTGVAGDEERLIYEAQLAWYLEAVARVTGAAVRGALLVV